MTKTNDIGQPILFETPDKGSGHFEFSQFIGSASAYALRGISQSGDSAYLGLFDQAEIRGLAKAILNAMEPESLVENQKNPEPAIAPAPFKAGGRVRVVSNIFDPRDASRGDLGTVSEIRYPFVAVNVDGKAVDFPFKSDEIEPAPVEQGYDVPALVASVADLEERVAALESKPEPEPSLWGYKVGDLVKYTRTGLGPTGQVRKVVDIDNISEVLRLAPLSDPTETPTGRAYSGRDITRA